MLRRCTSTSALPLTLALQAIALTLIAFFLAPSPSRRDESRLAGADLSSTEALGATRLEIPRDLARERLPVPRIPDIDKPEKEPAPRKTNDPPKAPIADGPKLAALRVSTVALASLATVSAPTSFPDAPDFLDAHKISGGEHSSWLSGTTRSASRDGGTGGSYPGPTGVGTGGRGWGGSGGGHGRGSGGSCPTPGRVGRPAGGRPGQPGGTVAGPTGGGRGPAGPAGGAGRGGERGGRGGKGSGGEGSGGEGRGGGRGKGGANR
jgi:hypothetical protein